MTVINIPPDGNIYHSPAPVPGTVHVYNVGTPAGPTTTYHLTIPHVVNVMHAHIAPGHTQSYQANGNVVYIQNLGPSKLQLLYTAGTGGQTPSEAGWTQADELPQ